MMAGDEQLSPEALQEAVVTGDAVPDAREGMTPEKLRKFERLYAMMKAMMVRKLMDTDCVPAEVPGHERYLCIGSVGAAYNREALADAGITHVLCVASNIRPRFPDELQYMVVEVLDKASEPMTRHFDSCHAFIRRARDEGGRVLVHCFAGKSRSSTVVLSYVMREDRLPLMDALESLRSVRPIAEPNMGFMSELRAWEGSLG